MKCDICSHEHDRSALRARCHPEAPPNLFLHPGPPEILVAKCSICETYVAGFLIKSGPFGIGGLAQVPS